MEDAELSELVKALNMVEEASTAADKIATLEREIEKADSAGRAETADYLRESLIQLAVFNGERVKALMAFARRLAYHDKLGPDESREDLSWSYKWIAEGLSDFASISRTQIDAALDDMERRFRAAGHGLQAVMEIRLTNAQEMGDAARASDLERDLRAMPKDGMSDCAACLVNRDVYRLTLKGEYAKAVTKARPILERGMRCAEVPQLTYGHLLLPLVTLGQLDKAQEFHRRNRRTIVSNNEFLSTAAQHLEFLAITGQIAPAIRLAENRLPHAMTCLIDARRLDLLQACRLLARRMDSDGRRSVKLNLPAGLPGANPDCKYAPAALVEVFDKAIRPIVAAFDARNGNSFVSSQDRRAQERTSLFTSMPEADSA